MIDILPQQQTLPHSTEAERAVLGAILLDPECLPDVQAWLPYADLYHDRHRLIYQAMLGLAAEGKTPDLLSLQALLEQRGQFETIGGLAYLTGLDLDLPDLGRLETYCEIIRDRADRRRLIRKAGEMIRAMLDGGGGGETVVEGAGKLISDLDGIVHRQVGGEGFKAVTELLPAYMELIEEPRPCEGLTTGIAALDNRYKAFERGRLLMIGGRAGVGKSAMMVQMIYRDALAGERCGVVSLEMKGPVLLNRIMAHGTGVAGTRLWRGNASPQEWTKAIMVQRFLNQQAGIFIDDAPVQRVSQIKAKARRLVKEHHVRAIYIDYGGLVERPGVRREHLEVEEMSYDLARLAAELDIVVVVMAQVNRGPAKEDRPPRVVDLREAGEQAAWYVLLLHRSLQEASGDEGEGKPVLYGPLGLVVLGKNRDGEEGGCRTYYDGPRLQWWDRNAWDTSGGQRGMLLPVSVQHELHVA